MPVSARPTTPRWVDTERNDKPFVVLFDPRSGRGAPYNEEHELMAHEASSELLDFALARHVHTVAWLPVHDLCFPTRPAWAGAGSLESCRLYWLRGRGPLPAHVNEIPDG